jgi:hypothetical protein
MAISITIHGETVDELAAEFFEIADFFRSLKSVPAPGVNKASRALKTSSKTPAPREESTPPRKPRTSTTRRRSSTQRERLMEQKVAAVWAGNTARGKRAAIAMAQLQDRGENITSSSVTRRLGGDTEEPNAQQVIARLRRLIDSADAFFGDPPMLESDSSYGGVRHYRFAREACNAILRRSASP